MRVFVTGPTGYIGSALVRALVAAGHEVTGLCRTAERERSLTALGGKPLRGDYKDLRSFLAKALEHDAFVHAAMEYSPEGKSRGGENVLALIEAAKGTGRPRSIVFTSGVWVLGDTRGLTDEAAPADHPAAAVTWRVPQESAVLAAGDDRVATAVLRPGIVYGRKGGFVTQWFTAAQQDGVVTYVGDGKNHWSFIHADDLAALYRVLLERQARGVFHGVDEKPTLLATAARLASEAAGRGATRSMALEAARKTMGPTADALVLDQQVLATRARELGWKPGHASFAEGVKAAYREFAG